MNPTFFDGAKKIFIIKGATSKQEVSGRVLKNPTCGMSSKLYYREERTIVASRSNFKLSTLPLSFLHVAYTEIVMSFFKIYNPVL